MREIIQIQVGLCGNQMGTSFWTALAEEHGIDPTGVYHGQSELQLRQLNVFFKEVAKGRHLARAILVDTDPVSIDSVRAGAFGKLFDPAAYFAGKCGTGRNWAKGYYTIGPDLCEGPIDQIRREVEACDRLQGFQITHSLSGGTGSGMGAWLLDKIRELYPDRMMCAYPILNTPIQTDAFLSPYNTTLAIPHLLENTDIAFLLDNQTLYNLCFQGLGIVAPTYSDLNKVVANTMTGVTCSLRFPGQLNSDLRKMAVNLIPFPRLHFMLPSTAPFLTPESLGKHKLDIHDLVTQAFDPRNMMCSIDPRHGRYFTAVAIFRGKVATAEVDNELMQLQNKHSSYFVEWIAKNLLSTVCNVPKPGYETHLTWIGNSTATQEIFKVVAEQFTEMFRRKAYLHWYLDEGMDEMEFTEAESNMNDLVSEYQPCISCYNSFQDDVE